MSSSVLPPTRCYGCGERKALSEMYLVHRSDLRIRQACIHVFLLLGKDCCQKKYQEENTPCPLCENFAPELNTNFAKRETQDAIQQLKDQGLFVYHFCSPGSASHYFISSKKLTYENQREITSYIGNEQSESISKNHPYIKAMYVNNSYSDERTIDDIAEDLLKEFKKNI